LQHVLYRAAKADPNRRFHALRDKVYREDVLQRAWIAVRRNNGAPGIDKTTLADVEEYGVSRLLGELASELQAGTWRPMPARQVLIPKPGSAERRPLAIAAVRDRIVQSAVKIVLEPVFEADFLPCSFGFRPGRSAHDALQVLIDEAWQGRRWVVETDIANCFSAIPHGKLMQAVEERVSDQAVLTLLRGMLRAGVMEGGQVRREVTGAPQGGPACPRPDPADHRPEAAVDGRRMDRGGTELVPARLGRLLPVRELRPHIRCDQPVHPGTAGRVRGQTPQTQPALGHAPGDLRVPGQLRADHLVRNRHRPQAVPALAGTGRMPAVKNVGEP